MSENREKREEQIQRLADAIGASNTMYAERLYDAGARIPDDPPGYPASNPVQRAKELLASLTEEQRAEVMRSEGVQERPVVISDACYQAVLAVQHPDPDSRLIRQLRAALPHILSANPWLYDAEIRRRVEALSTTIWYPPAGTGQPLVRMPRADGAGPVVSRADLLAALGVAP